MSGSAASGPGADGRGPRRGQEILFIDLGPEVDRSKPSVDGGDAVVRPTRLRWSHPRRSTLVAAVCAVALAATGVFLPAIIQRGSEVSGWLEPYPRVPEQAWTVAVTGLVKGPGTGSARFAVVPGASTRGLTGVLPFGSTWVTYIASDEALPRFVGLDAETGVRRWVYEVRNWGPVQACADTSLGGALICLGSAGTAGTDVLVLIRLSDGREVARRPVSIDANSITVVGDDVVLGGYDVRTHEFLAQRLNVWTGELAWTARVADPVGLTGTYLEGAQGGGPPIRFTRGTGDSLDVTFGETTGVATTAVALAGPGAVLLSNIGSHVWLDLETGTARGPATSGTAVRRGDGAVLIDASTRTADGAVTTRDGQVWWAQASKFVAAGGGREIDLPVWTSPEQRVVGWREGSPPIIGVPVKGGPLAGYASLDGSLLWTASGGAAAAVGADVPDAELITPHGAFLVSGPRDCGFASGRRNGWSCRATGPRVCAVDPADGAPLWCKDLGVGEVTVIGWDGTRLVVRGSTGVSALDGQTGASVWTLPGSAIPDGSSFEAVGGRVVAYTSSHIVVLGPTGR